MPCWDIADQFLLGEDLLVARVATERARERSVYLPTGADWRDAWTGAPLAGGRWLTAPALTQQFLHSKAAMIIDGPWIFPELNAAGWKYNQQYGIVPIPVRQPGQTVVTPNGTGQMTRSARLSQPPPDWVLAVPCGGLTAVTAQVYGVQVLSRPPGTWRCGGTATLPRSSKGGDSRTCASGPVGSAISRSSVSTACLPICSAGTSAALTCG